MSGESDLVDIALDLKAETEKAFQVSDGVTTVWLPKSQVERNSDGTFTMPEWIAMQRGLI